MVMAAAAVAWCRRRRRTWRTSRSRVPAVRAPDGEPGDPGGGGGAAADAGGAHRRVLHIVDLDAAHGVQWPPLLQAIADRADPPSARRPR